MKVEGITPPGEVAMMKRTQELAARTGPSTSRKLRLAGVAIAMLALAVGATAFGGLEVPASVGCDVPEPRDGCAIQWSTTQLPWVIVPAVAGALVLMLREGVLARNARWIWAGGAALALTAVAPVVYGVRLVRGELLYPEPSAEGILLAVTTTVAVTLSVLVGVCVLVERAHPRYRSGITASMTLATFIAVGLAFAVTDLVTGSDFFDGAYLIGLSVAALGAAALVPLALGHTLPAKLVLATLSLGLLILAVLIGVAGIAIAGSEGAGYAWQIVALLGAPVIALVAATLAAWLAGVRPHLRLEQCAHPGG